MYSSSSSKPSSSAPAVAGAPSLSYLESLPDEMLAMHIFPYLNTAYLMKLRQVSVRFRRLIDSRVLTELSPWYALPNNVNYKIPPRLAKKITIPYPYKVGILSCLSELNTQEVVIFFDFVDQIAVCDMWTGTHFWEQQSVTREFVQIYPFGRFHILEEHYVRHPASGNFVIITDRTKQCLDQKIELRGAFRPYMLSNGIHLVIGYDNDTIDVIDCATTNVLYRLNIKYSYLEPLYGGRLGVGCKDGFIRIFNVGKLETGWQAHNGEVGALRILSDGDLASASFNGGQIELATWECAIKCGRFHASRDDFLKDRNIRTKRLPPVIPDPRDADL